MLYHMAMGTNYYLKKSPDVLETLMGKKPLRLHIGKSSGGWCFSLRWYPEHNLNSLRDWYRLLRRKRSTITDEYDREITCKEMLEIIACRSWAARPREFPNKWYASEAEFYRINHAEPGPNNLLRHQENSYTKHGPGTWDLINQEFS